ncbi:recombinase family protein [Sorangium sp. So ce693]|uniref:recombinase family protein n=1 Tax=Sorangium sp. So ce693 TaxID=3133318 RepID=UPI003F5EE896
MSRTAPPPSPTETNPSSSGPPRSSSSRPRSPSPTSSRAAPNAPATSSRSRPRSSARSGASSAVACLRVSKDELTQELGLEAQRAAILAWAQRQGVSIVAWVNEEVSGGAELDERPRLLAAVAAVEAHRAGYLVFHRLDRFARNTTTAALVQSALSRVGASLVSADGVGNGDDPASRLVRGILLEVAAFERSLIQARIVAALAVKRRRGELVGGVPYGYRFTEGPPKRGRGGQTRPVRLLVPEPEEQATLSEARRLRAAGRSVRQVIAELAAQGRTSRTGRPFAVSAMHAMLRRGEGGGREGD